MQADLREVIAWANAAGVRWAFSDRNAGAYLASFSCQEAELAGLDWPAIENRDFRDFNVKEGKQAEFLVYESLPWELVEEIGVLTAAVATAVTKIIAAVPHKPVVRVRPEWYY